MPSTNSDQTHRRLRGSSGIPRSRNLAADSASGATTPTVASKSTIPDPNSSNAESQSESTPLSMLFNWGYLPQPSKEYVPGQAMKNALGSMKSSSSAGTSKSDTSMSGSPPTADTTMDSMSSSKLESSESSDYPKKDTNEGLIDAFMDFMAKLNEAAVEEKQVAVLGHLCEKLEQSFREHLASTTKNASQAAGKKASKKAASQAAAGKEASKMSAGALDMINGGRLVEIIHDDPKLVSRYGRAALANSASVLQSHKIDILWRARKKTSSYLQELGAKYVNVESTVNEYKTMTNDLNDLKIKALLRAQFKTEATLNVALDAITGSLPAQAAINIRRLYEDARSFIFKGSECAFPGLNMLLYRTSAPFDVSALGQVTIDSFAERMRGLYNSYHEPSSPKYLFDDLVKAHPQRTMEYLVQGPITINKRTAGRSLQEVFFFFLPRLQLIQLFFHYLFVALDEVVRRFEHDLMHPGSAYTPQSEVDDPQSEIIAEHSKSLEALKKIHNVPKLVFLFEDRFKDMISVDYDGPLHIPFRDVVYPSDSAAVPSDSAAVPSDSAAVPSDSAAVPSDSAAVPPHSAAVPPHSAAVPPHSAAVPPVPAAVSTVSKTFTPDKALRDSKFVDSHDPQNANYIGDKRRLKSDLPYQRNIKHSSKVKVKTVDDAYNSWDATISNTLQELSNNEETSEVAFLKYLYPAIDDATAKKLRKLQRRRNDARENANALRYLIHLIDKGVVDEILGETPMRGLLNRHAHARIHHTSKADVRILIEKSDKLLGLNAKERERTQKLNEILGDALPYGQEYLSSTPAEFPTSVIRERKTGAAGHRDRDVDLEVLKTGLENLKKCVFPQ